jgi:hypothetical protein
MLTLSGYLCRWTISTSITALTWFCKIYLSLSRTPKHFKNLWPRPIKDIRNLWPRPIKDIRNLWPRPIKDIRNLWPRPIKDIRNLASDKAYQLLAHGWWFSPGTPASSTTKTGRHDIAEILLKVELNTKNQPTIKRYVKYQATVNVLLL